MRTHPEYARFPQGFFDRSDPGDDAIFYSPARLVTHIDDAAINEVGRLYDELEVTGRVLDLMSSWISHLVHRPQHLTVLGMNRTELEANPMADAVVVQDLNARPTLDFADHEFDDVVCAVSVDYLVQPLEVFAEARRVLRPGGRFIVTFSNRCFPTKAIRGWLMASEPQRCAIVAEYFRAVAGFDDPVIDDRSHARFGDPLFGVWAATTSAPNPAAQ